MSLMSFTTRSQGPIKCEKITYHSPEEAERARKRIMRHGKNYDPDRFPMTSYRCNACGFWHIGHGIDYHPLKHKPERRPQHRKNWREWGFSDD